MIIIITSEKYIQNEVEVINKLFREGLDLLHIRKPFFTPDEMTDFIQKIDKNFHQQLVLHNYYEVAKEFDISRFHFRETNRQNNDFENFVGNIISTSVHDIETFNELNKNWEYSFISPVFPSISKKGYGESSTIVDDIKRRNNPQVKLIALGGINEKNIQKIFKNDVDGVALLGAIWESNEPIKIFEKCRQSVLL